MNERECSLVAAPFGDHAKKPSCVVPRFGLRPAIDVEHRFVEPLLGIGWHDKVLFRRRLCLHSGEYVGLRAITARHLQALDVSKKCPQGVPSPRSTRIVIRYPR